MHICLTLNRENEIYQINNSYKYRNGSCRYRNLFINVWQ